MPFVAKIDPQPELQGAVNLRVHARGFNDPKVEIGDTVYVWTSERAGGEGLVARGIAKRISAESFPNKTGSGVHMEIVLSLDLDKAIPNRKLSILQIGEYRDRGGPAPYEELAHVLYEHAHNKIVALTDAASEFLDAYFLGNRWQNSPPFTAGSFN